MQDLTPARILIVDDSEDDVLLASAYIRRTLRGARFRRVETAPELEAALAEQRWDVVLCDHNMPGFDSARALDVVRRTDARLPFFVYSGEFSRTQAAAALESGVDGVLEKRDTQAMLRAIEGALRQAPPVAATQVG